ncbi:acyl carrier protein [Micromonospora sp. NPDC050695]|uniref:acyl carrier protein n=1 Tax=Micromonospora sp. NPDC050695 TaxID=3154938 RepID=UPI0033D585CF
MFTPGTPQPGSGEPTDSVWLQAFREVLPSEDINEDTNFFQAGGHSLLIPKLLTCYESRSGWRPPVSLLFKFASPRELEAESAALRERTVEQGSR